MCSKIKRYMAEAINITKDSSEPISYSIVVNNMTIFALRFEGCDGKTKVIERRIASCCEDFSSKDDNVHIEMSKKHKTGRLSIAFDGPEEYVSQVKRIFGGKTKYCKDSTELWVFVLTVIIIYVVIVLIVRLILLGPEMMHYVCRSAYV